MSEDIENEARSEAGAVAPAAAKGPGPAIAVGARLAFASVAPDWPRTSIRYATQMEPVVEPNPSILMALDGGHYDPDLTATDLAEDLASNIANGLFVEDGLYDMWPRFRFALPDPQNPGQRVWWRLASDELSEETGEVDHALRAPWDNWADMPTAESVVQIPAEGSFYLVRQKEAAAQRIDEIYENAPVLADSAALAEAFRLNNATQALGMLDARLSRYDAAAPARDASQAVLRDALATRIKAAHDILANALTRFSGSQAAAASPEALAQFRDAATMLVSLLRAHADVQVPLTGLQALALRRAIGTVREVIGDLQFGWDEALARSGADTPRTGPDPTYRAKRYALDTLAAYVPGAGSRAREAEYAPEIQEAVDVLRTVAVQEAGGTLPESLPGMLSRMAAFRDKSGALALRYTIDSMEERFGPDGAPPVPHIDDVLDMLDGLADAMTRPGLPAYADMSVLVHRDYPEEEAQQLRAAGGSQEEIDEGYYDEDWRMFRLRHTNDLTPWQPRVEALEPSEAHDWDRRGDERKLADAEPVGWGTNYAELFLDAAQVVARLDTVARTCLSSPAGAAAVARDVLDAIRALPLPDETRTAVEAILESAVLDPAMAAAVETAPGIFEPRLAAAARQAAGHVSTLFARWPRDLVADALMRARENAERILPDARELRVLPIPARPALEIVRAGAAAEAPRVVDARDDLLGLDALNLQALEPRAKFSAVVRPLSPALVALVDACAPPGFDDRFDGAAHTIAHLGASSAALYEEAGPDGQSNSGFYFYEFGPDSPLSIWTPDELRNAVARGTPATETIGLMAAASSLAKPGIPAYIAIECMAQADDPVDDPDDLDRATAILRVLHPADYQAFPDPPQWVDPVAAKAFFAAVTRMKPSRSATRMDLDALRAAIGTHAALDFIARGDGASPSVSIAESLTGDEPFGRGFIADPARRAAAADLLRAALDRSVRSPGELVRMSVDSLAPPLSAAALQAAGLLRADAVKLCAAWPAAIVRAIADAEAESLERAAGRIAAKPGIFGLEFVTGDLIFGNRAAFSAGTTPAAIVDFQSDVGAAPGHVHRLGIRQTREGTLALWVDASAASVAEHIVLHGWLTRSVAHAARGLHGTRIRDREAQWWIVDDPSAADRSGYWLTPDGAPAPKAYRLRRADPRENREFDDAYFGTAERAADLRERAVNVWDDPDPLNIRDHAQTLLEASVGYPQADDATHIVARAMPTDAQASSVSTRYALASTLASLAEAMDDPVKFPAAADRDIVKAQLAGAGPHDPLGIAARAASLVDTQAGPGRNLFYKRNHEIALGALVDLDVAARGALLRPRAARRLAGRAINALAHLPGAAGIVPSLRATLAQLDQAAPVEIEPGLHADPIDATRRRAIPVIAAQIADARLDAVVSRAQEFACDALSQIPEAVYQPFRQPIADYGDSVLFDGPLLPPRERDQTYFCVCGPEGEIVPADDSYGGIELYSDEEDARNDLDFAAHRMLIDGQAPDWTNPKHVAAAWLAVFEAEGGGLEAARSYLRANAEALEALREPATLPHVRHIGATLRTTEVPSGLFVDLDRPVDAQPPEIARAIVPDDADERPDLRVPGRFVLNEARRLGLPIAGLDGWLQHSFNPAAQAPARRVRVFDPQALRMGPIVRRHDGRIGKLAFSALTRPARDPLAPANAFLTLRIKPTATRQADGEDDRAIADEIAAAHGGWRPRPWRDTADWSSAVFRFFDPELAQAAARAVRARLGEALALAHVREPLRGTRDEAESLLHVAGDLYEWDMLDNVSEALALVPAGGAFRSQDIAETREAAAQAIEDRSPAWLLNAELMHPGFASTLAGLPVFDDAPGAPARLSRRARGELLSRIHATLAGIDAIAGKRDGLNMLAEYRIRAIADAASMADAADGGAKRVELAQAIEMVAARRAHETMLEATAAGDDDLAAFAAHALGGREVPPSDPFGDPISETDPLDLAAALPAEDAPPDIAVLVGRDDADDTARIVRHLERAAAQGGTRMRIYVLGPDGPEPARGWTPSPDARGYVPGGHAGYDAFLAQSGPGGVQSLQTRLLDLLRSDAPRAVVLVADSGVAEAYGFRHGPAGASTANRLADSGIRVVSFARARVREPLEARHFKRIATIDAERFVATKDDLGVHAFARAPSRAALAARRLDCAARLEGHAEDFRRRQPDVFARIYGADGRKLVRDIAAIKGATTAQALADAAERTARLAAALRRPDADDLAREIAHELAPSAARRAREEDIDAIEADAFGRIDAEACIAGGLVRRAGKAAKEGALDALDAAIEHGLVAAWAAGDIARAARRARAATIVNDAGTWLPAEIVARSMESAIRARAFERAHPSAAFKAGRGADPAVPRGTLKNRERSAMGRDAESIEVAQILRGLSGHRRTSDVFEAWIEAAAVALGAAMPGRPPRTDAADIARRKAALKAIVDKFAGDGADENRKAQIRAGFAKLSEIVATRFGADRRLPGAAAKDFLGRIFMGMDWGNRYLGQFFTPDDIGALLADISIDGAAADWLADPDRKAADRPFFYLQEPACGAGALMLAAAGAVERAGIGRDGYMIDGIERDHLTAKMAFVQCALAGIPARIFRGDALGDPKSWVCVGVTPNVQALVRRFPDWFERARKREVPLHPGWMRVDAAIANPPFGARTSFSAGVSPNADAAARTAAVDGAGRAIRLFHGTLAGDIGEWRAGTHFGSAAAANARLAEAAELDPRVLPGWGPAGDTPAIYPVYLDISCPFDMEDGLWDVDHYAASFEAAGIASAAQLAAIREGDIDPHEHLRARGYDGIRYVNSHEDPGSLSWIAFQPAQIRSAFSAGVTAQPRARLKPMIREAVQVLRYTYDRADSTYGAELLVEGDKIVYAGFASREALAEHLGSAHRTARFSAGRSGAAPAILAQPYPERGRPARGTQAHPLKTLDARFLREIEARLDAQGRAAIVVSPGLLYRSGAEAALRADLVRSGRLRAVVQFPQKLFATTGTAIAALLFDGAIAPGKNERIVFAAADDPRVDLATLAREIAARKPVAGRVALVKRSALLADPACRLSPGAFVGLKPVDDRGSIDDVAAIVAGGIPDAEIAAFALKHPQPPGIAARLFERDPRHGRWRAVGDTIETMSAALRGIPGLEPDVVAAIAREAHALAERHLGLAALDARSRSVSAQIEKMLEEYLLPAEAPRAAFSAGASEDPPPVSRIRRPIAFNLDGVDYPEDATPGKIDPATESFLAGELRRFAPFARLAFADVVVPRGRDPATAGVAGAATVDFATVPASAPVHVVALSRLADGDRFQLLLHEVMHTLYSSGRISGPEWDMLKRSAQSDSWPVPYGYDNPRFDPDLVLHERIAERFGDYGYSQSRDPSADGGDFQFPARPLAPQGSVRADAREFFDAILNGEVGARAPDRELERWRLRRLNIPTDDYEFSFSAARAPRLDRVEIGPDAYGYDYADRQGFAVDRRSEPANLRAAIAELTRIAPFVDIHVHDFVGDATRPKILDSCRFTPGTPVQPPGPMSLHAGFSREYADADPTIDGRATWMNAARTGFLAHYYSGRLSMDDIVAIHQDLAANDWRPFHDELLFGTIDFSTDFADERGRLALAASRYAVWARENRPLGPSSVEQGPGGGRTGDADLLPGDARILRDDPRAPRGDGLRHPADPPSGTGALTRPVEAIFRSIADTSRVAAFDDPSLARARVRRLKVVDPDRYSWRAGHSAEQTRSRGASVPSERSAQIHIAKPAAARQPASPTRTVSTRPLPELDKRALAPDPRDPASMATARARLAALDAGSLDIAAKIAHVALKRSDDPAIRRRLEAGLSLIAAETERRNVPEKPAASRRTARGLER